MQSSAAPDNNAPIVHRVLSPLNWVRSPGQGLDGDVRSVEDKTTGRKIYMLKAHQPKPGKSPRGASFFTPRPDFSKATHAYLGSGDSGYSVADPANLKLPPSLQLNSDGPLMLPLNGKDDPKVECGDHWTLYTTTGMPATEFEAAYQIVLSQMTPCVLVGSASGSFVNLSPDIDWDRMPSDKLTYAVAQALEDLSNSTSHGNVRLFAGLFSHHLRATDIEFESVLQFGAIASMAEAALDAWTVRDPFLYANACEAQKLLRNGSDDYMPTGPIYEPTWVRSL